MMVIQTDEIAQSVALEAVRADAAPILITGVSRRLGAALAKAFVLKGWPVMGTYRQASEATGELATLGVQLLQADLADEASVWQLIRRVNASTPRLRAIVHNASVWHKDAVLQADPGLLQATFALHVTTPWLLNQQLAPLLLAHEGLKDIVLIGDASCVQGKADAALYTASKAAMESIMRSQAVALAPQIKVNMLAPGLLAFHPHDDAAYRQRRLAQNLLPQAPGFQPAIEAIEYLLRSPYTTGSCLVLDGGAQRVSP